MACLISRTGIYYIVSCQGGKRLWKSLHTRCIDDARIVYDNFEREQGAKKTATLSWLLEQILVSLGLNLSEATLGIYKLSFRNFIRLCGDRPIRYITPLIIEKFKALRVREVSPVTLNIDLRTLRAAFNEAKRLKLIHENPFEGVKLFRVPEKEGACLTEDDVRRLMKVIDDPEFRNLVMFAILTVMRLGELTHLEWNDIDLARRDIRIRNKMGFRVKGGKPRTIPMSPWVYEFLSKQELKKGLIFKNAKGYQLIGGSVSHRFKRSVRRAELSDSVHFHSLRHTGISWLINRGVPPPFVQRLAGHSSLLTTGIYSHVEDRSLIGAVNAFPLLN